jgi:tmRNA-binding protein
MTCLNQKNIVKNKQAKPEYNIYTELLSGLSRLFIVLEAPITRTNKENAINIGNLL